MYAISTCQDTVESILNFTYSPLAVLCKPFLVDISVGILIELYIVLTFLLLTIRYYIVNIVFDQSPSLAGAILIQTDFLSMFGSVQTHPVQTQSMRMI